MVTAGQRVRQAVLALILILAFVASGMAQESTQLLPRGHNGICCIGRGLDEECSFSRAFSFPEAVTIITIYDYYIKYRAASAECLLREGSHLDVVSTQLEMLKIKGDQIRILEQDRNYYRSRYLELSENCGPATCEAWTWAGWIISGALIFAGGAYYAIEHLDQ